MLYRVIDASELPSLVQAFAQNFEVVAPVKKGGAYTWAKVNTFDEIVLDYTTTITSPKKYVLPAEEVLMRFNRETNDVEEFEESFPPRVIFGAHPCDINALNRLDITFRDAPYKDPYYKARRESCLVVGISCTPEPTCFCHLWGCDEARFGFDLFLHNIGEKYLVEISSVEAANVLEQACDLYLATDEDRKAFRHATRAHQEAFNKEIPDIQEVGMLMDAFHSDPFWEELGGKCLSCGACTSVCPTCFCFDIRDELDPSGVHGVRKRVQDGCTNPQFALVAGGHNFRDDGRCRVRHRMYHKLSAFLANHDRMLCVGCGRCVSACKANINPIEVLKFFQRKGA